MDKEGLLMSIALSECRTVDDFATLLDSLPKPLGVEANFGVIDAYGGAAYFETNNWEYERFNVDDTEEGYLIRTNYSKSGRKGEGYGYIREQNAEHLLAPYIANHSVTPAVFTEVLSRSFYHSLIDKDFEHDTVEWVVDRDFIPRRISSASVAIEGVVASENTTDAVMWTVLGYPPWYCLSCDSRFGAGRIAGRSSDRYGAGLRSRECFEKAKFSQWRKIMARTI